MAGNEAFREARLVVWVGGFGKDAVLGDAGRGGGDAGIVAVLALGDCGRLLNLCFVLEIRVVSLMAEALWLTGSDGGAIGRSDVLFWRW